MIAFPLSQIDAMTILADALCSIELRTWLEIMSISKNLYGWNQIGYADFNHESSIDLFFGGIGVCIVIEYKTETRSRKTN